MEVKKQQKPDTRKPIKTKEHFVWLGSYITVACICIVVYFFIRFNVITIPGRYHDMLQKLSLAGFLAILILSISKLAEILILKKSRTKYKRYNLIRLTHLISLIAVGILIISFLFANWYAAAVSLGLFSLILGFALQTPISSFIGWIYIIIRNPYRIGDRIQIDTFKGDVIEIGYLDTTLWEFAGDYLTNDLPSGRLIRFPNSMVLQSSVFNYSWRDFHYIWNEIPFHVAYESDLEFVEKTIKQVTKNELGDKMEQRIEELKALVKESPIDDMEIKEYPYVTLRINSNTWVEATVTYLVPPKQAASIRTQIIKRVIDALKKQPDKTMFPKSNSR
jgi:small-conductance mechanosensitive channel